jgi:hypothetical protein
MQPITIDDVQSILDKPIPEEKRARVLLDIAASTEILEGWARRKFTPTNIVGEMHYLVNSPRVFLHWGEPVPGTLMVHYTTPDSPATPVTAYYNDFYYVNSYAGIGWFDYAVDMTKVNQYENAIRRIIIEGVVQKYMLPDAARFRVINNYSVEGLSISYAGAANGGNQSTEETFIGLTDILPLRRRIVL